MVSLNTKIFEIDDNGIWTMKRDVRKALLKISQAFVDFVKDNGIMLEPADIHLVGSNAGEDFTDNSDIDLHIVADFEGIGCSDGIIQAAFNAQRSLFNSSYDITVKGIPVELYVEDVKAGTESNGIYSVMYDRWIKYPERQEGFSDEFKDIYADNLKQWNELITAELGSNSSSTAQRLLNRIYMMRKNGIATQGRYSAGNYIFKELRNSGLLQQLRDHRDKLLSQELSLESANRNAFEALFHRNCTV